MTPTTLEQRVERLERIVDGLREKTIHEPGSDDWRTTIGAFSSDPQASEILDEAALIRENERRQSVP